ncbi:MAG: phage virion morphogenesis protein [Proteobacteria bacterium]|nr:phage virion morphogenesis protein [Pseudomonadota bacterium]
MVSVSAKFKELDKYIENFKSLNDEAKENLNDHIAGVLESSTVRRFETEKDPEGKSWKPNLRGGKILTLHGYLCGSIIGQATKDYAEVGSVLEYSRIHQEGGVIQFVKKKGSVTMPARPYLGVSKQDKAAIGRVIESFINGALS